MTNLLLALDGGPHLIRDGRRSKGIQFLRVERDEPRTT